MSNIWLDLNTLEEIKQELSDLLETFIGMPYDNASDLFDAIKILQTEYFESDPDLLRFKNNIIIQIYIVETNINCYLESFVVSIKFLSI